MSTTPFSELIKQAAEAKYVVVPNDDYAIAVKSCTDIKASTGKDMLKLSVKVLVGPHQGASLITQQTLSPENPAAIAMFLKFLDSFGLDEEFLAALPPREDGGPNLKAVAAALVGRAAMATVGTQEWQGEDRNNIEKFKKPTADQQAMIEAAIASAGGTSPFSAPSTGPADPFAAAAAAEGTADEAASF